MSYTADNIQVLNDLDAIRKRPSMYIGDVSQRGLHHLVFEVVDNSIDEALAGYCDEIEVIIDADGSITVRDNGRGIPTDLIGSKSALDVVLTTLHAGGKFDKKSYKASGGLHGVGLSVVNALSEWLEVKVRRDGKEYFQSYKRGKPVDKPNKVGNAGDSGTEITFEPDEEIFKDIEFKFDIIQNRLRELAYLNKGLRITLEDERNDEKKDFKFDGGLLEFVKHLNKNKVPIHEPIYLEDCRDGISVELAMQYTNGYTENILSFANNVNTQEGGTHLAGFKSVLTRIINEKSGNEKVQGEDTRESLTAVLSVMVEDPQFEGQTKTKLGNVEVKNVTSTVIKEHLSNFLEENPEICSKIVENVRRAARARKAAKKARELVRKRNLTSDLSGKLAECTEKSHEKREIFIVEGESAGGSAKQARERRFQAVLSLKGKILNVEKAGLDRILRNSEIRNIIVALGTGIGDDFDLNRARYNKIICMADADVDGSHIVTLLLTFFYRYMKPLIGTERVYIAKPPLYGIKKGSTIKYAYDDMQLESILDDERDVSIQRYKGLGEMSPDQLWDTVMNPASRVIKKVNINDAMRADEIFTTLMGDRVEPRRAFIQEHAREASLDI